MSPAPSGITVVLCTRDRPERLPRALAALRASLGPSDRGLVVDSASRSAETMRVAEGAGFDCVRLDLPGLSRARNAGVRHAATEIVAFTDDDCVATPEWLESLRNRFAGDQSLGFVTGRVRAEAPGTASVIDREGEKRFMGVRDPYQIGHGANMAFRRSALSEVGPFDEELGAGAPPRSGEDADMLFRVMEAGWVGLYDPAAVVAHTQWRDTTESRQLFFGYGLGNGAFRAKVARRRSRTGLRLIAGSLWRQAAVSLWHGLLMRNPRNLVNTLSWTAGMVVGLFRGFRSPIGSDGLFVPAGRSR